MKATLFTLGFAATASANIIFNHVPLKCNITSTQMYHGCLRGQDCTAQGDCVALENINYPKSFGSVPNLQLRADVFSTDGTCGPKNGNTVCDPNSKAYTGGCCSQYGYCGNTADHCGTGCTSGCQNQAANAPTNPTTPANPATPVAARQDGRCGKEFGNSACDANGPFGGCCSEYGYCGSTEGHCKASNGCQNGCDGSNPPTTPAQPNTPTTATTPDSPARDDGRCGKEFGGASCDPLGEFGGCCSEYGYCGNTEGHCLKANGCQDGCTDGGNTGIKGGDGAAAPAPTASPSTSAEPVIAPATSTAPPHVVATAAATTDGSCGSTNGGTVCGNWANGNCCSMYGFCGATSAHCGAGCQSGNCLNAPAVAAPGPSPAPAAPNKGSFKVVGDSGVPAMHAALMPNGKVMFLDKLENYTQLRNPNGQYAMSSEYDPVTNKVVPLAYDTNAFCSGGVFLADGRVISVGGNGPLDWLDPNIKDGFDAIRYLGRSSSDAGLDGQSWSEPGNKLASKRWYASAQTMPDGTIFVASGSLNGLDPTVLANNNPTWELLDRNAVSNGQNIEMEILKKNQPYYMYPFVHLLNDGNLFVFTSKSSQIFNVGSNTIVKELPDLPGDYRTYPNTGGSVMMALTSKNNWAPDVIICGGGAYQDINSPTDPSCGRIQPLNADATWEMDSMPQGRGMVEGTLLADGSIVWLNGGNRGAQGFGIMKDPTLDALLYEPNKPKGQRFSTLATSEIPRLYHSVALLLLDGTLMVTGSNPVEMPMLQADANNPYVTDFRVEIYTPPYLQGDNANRRPTNIAISSLAIKADGSNFQIQFTAPANAKEVKVSLYHGGFVTHSVHMGHRMLELDVSGFTAGGTQQSITVAGPPNLNVAPPGPYVVYVLVDGVPGIGQFVSVS